MKKIPLMETSGVFFMKKIIALLVLMAVIASIARVFAADAPAFAVAEAPKNMGPLINGQRNDFAPTVNPDGSSLIFNSNRGGTYQDLYIAYFKDGQWSAPELLRELNSPFNDETPFLSADGNTIIFSSDRDGSVEMPRDERGQVRVSFDLWWSKRVDGRWTTPRPVPGAVNTIYNEKSPSLSRDGKTLYYSAWPFGTIGRAVTVRAELVDGAFKNPTPLPAPFNSGYQDLGLVPAEDLKGFFFSSNRPGGLGEFDLYYVSYNAGVFGTPVNLGDKVNSAKSELYLARADQRYFICSTREGGQGLFDLYASFIFNKEASFETRAIHFDFDQAKIRQDSYPYLDALAEFLKAHRLVNIEIIGHTDLHGTDEYNNRLSLQRAEAVRRYLKDRGLDVSTVRVTGAGKRQPLEAKTGPGYDELNRRTEFRIIKEKG